MEVDLNTPGLKVQRLPTFRVGSNAGGGERVELIPPGGGRRETVYRFETRSVGGRPRDTTEETPRWRELRAAGLVK